MAYQVTIAEIKQRARMRADMRGSSFVSDAELLQMINEAWAELYDLLIGSYAHYYVNTFTFTINNTTNAYALPNDFYKIIGVDFKAATDQYITIYPYMETERNMSFTTVKNIPSGQIRFRYAPAPQKFTSDSDVLDTISGWDSLLVTDVAIMMLDSEESSTAALENRRRRQLQRITEMAQNRDAGMPQRVTDVYNTNVQRIFASLRYRLYGNNIEFISTEFSGNDLVYSMVM